MLLVNNRALLDGFRAGRPESLREVYEHYAPRVFGQLRGGFGFSSGRRMLRFQGYRRPYDLENAVQDVFIRAFAPRARLAYDGLRPYGEYLLAIARNLVLNELRRKEALFVEEEQADETAPRTEELFEQRELDRLLADFVAALDGARADYYRVRFVDGRTQVDAARELRMNRIIARRLEARLKLELLEHLKTHGYLDSIPTGIVGSLAPVRR